MSTAMFRKSAKDLGWTTLWYAAGLAFYGFVIVLFFPSMSGLHEQIDKAFPAALRKAFGITDYGTLAGFVGAEFLNVMWPLIASAFLVMAGTAVVAQEIERGTIEVWLSVPATRTALLTTKITALFAGALILIVATLASLSIGAALIGKSLPGDHLLALGIVMAAFAVTVAACSALLSTLSDSRGPAAGVAAAVVLGSYLAWIVAALSSSWEWLRHVSLFTPFRAQDALARGTVDWLGLAVLAAISLACIVGAVTVFKRRDAIA